MDPNHHEHPQGFPEHSHPHAETYHMDFDGITGKGEATGHAVLEVPGAADAIIGDHPHPEKPPGVVAEGADWSGQSSSVFDRVPVPQRFIINRLVDESGVSGTGVVAVGVRWPTGKCSVEWIVEPHTQGMYDSIDDVVQIHGHKGKTVVMWMGDKTVLQ